MAKHELLHPSGAPARLACTVGLGLALVAASTAAQAWPPDDGIGIGGGVTVTTPIGPGGISYRSTTISFQAGLTAPVYAHDGDYSGRGVAFAQVETSIWLVPMLTGNVRQAFEPLTLHVGFNSAEKYAPSGDYSDPSFGLNSSADIVVPLDGSAASFELNSALSVDPGGLGPSWLHFQFPLMEYHYSTQDGNTSRLLGLSLDLSSAGGVPCSLGQACEFDRGYWSFTVQAVPEPSTAALSGVGGLVLWALSWRRRRAPRSLG